ncbi:MAG TPA: SAM-dependent methyltransferase [Bdellovibrionota bacterium]|jgi:16S rRNA (cytidine1402-2'-O)-methyltransferase|nr:SAM-dependent methyltransferase [Bdellovibrionota bacterium]
MPASAPLPDRLSVVAVPIGNPRDLSPRAGEALASAQVIFCEDTRKTLDLLKRSGISSGAKLIAVPGDSEFQTDWQRYCSPEYRHWVLVSDAGTPIVNDPGSSLLEFCRKQGVLVEALPGASAPTLAWQWSGGFGLPFSFAGFAPKVSRSATSKWEHFLPAAQTQGTFCFFDTRHQVMNTLEYIAETYPNARLYIAREMTKAHEELLFGSASELAAIIAQRLEADQVGELCLLLDMASLQSEGAAPAAQISPEDLIKFRTASTKDASKMMAKWCNLPTRDAYKRLCDET